MELQKNEKNKLILLVDTYKSIYNKIEKVSDQIEKIVEQKNKLIEELIKNRSKETKYIEHLKEKYNITENDIKNMFIK